MPRHNSVLLISVIAHVLAITAFLIVSILAPDILPTPRTLLAWDAPRMVQVDIPLPPTPPARRPPGPVPPPSNPGAAPVVAPDTIADETVPSIAPPPVEPGVVEGSVPGSLLERIEPPPPPPPPTPARRIERVGGAIRPPTKVFDVAPNYPAMALQAGVQGVVIIEASISETGDVVGTRVLRSIPLLDRAAIDAVMQWRFTPVLLNGVPVPVAMTVTVNFQLNR